MEPDKLPEEAQHICAYSGRTYPESEMVRLGVHWIAVEHKEAAVQFLQQGNELVPPLPPGSDVPSLKLWPLLARSWEVFLRHGWLLLVLDFTVTLPVSLLDSFLHQDVFDETEIFPSLAYDMVISATLSSVGMALVLAVLSAASKGKRLGYADAWKAVLRRLPAVLLVSFLTTFLSLVGFVLCLVPGFIVVVKLTFALCFVMDANQGNTALMSSSDLVTGRFWKVLGFMLPVSVALMAPLTAFYIAAEFLPESWARWELLGSIEAVLSLPVVFLTVFTFVFYRSLAVHPPPAHV